MLSDPRGLERYLVFGIGAFSHLPIVVSQMGVGHIAQWSGVQLTVVVKCDTLGNVYAGCGDGLHIWSESRFLHPVSWWEGADCRRSSWAFDRQDVGQSTS